MDPWDAVFGYSGVPDASWRYEMPQVGDLLKYNPGYTGAGLADLLDLGNIGGAMPRPDVSTFLSTVKMPNMALVSNATNNPYVGAMERNATPAPASTPGSFWKDASARALDLVKRNPAAFLTLLGAGGAGIAGAVKGSDTVKLPKEVNALVQRATAPQGPDPYEQAELDRVMRRDLGPGWETSTPGIQAKAYQNYLRQKGDQSAAAAALGPVGNLYANQQNRQSQEQQALYALATQLGVLGLGGLGAFSNWGYAR